MARRTNWENQIGRRLRLRDLHVLFMVAERGSMAKAATELGISQPSVSDVIANLESALGVRLLDRNPHGVEPTMYGHALLKRGLAAFDELKQGIRDIEFLSDPTAGELRIGCAEAVAAILTPILEPFFQKYPRVVIHMDPSDNLTLQMPALRDRRCDLVLRARRRRALSGKGGGQGSERDGRRARERLAEAEPGAAALTWEGEDGEVRHFTARQLRDAVELAAAMLVAEGVRPGDRVGILLPMLPVTALRGILRWQGPPATLEEMDKAIAEGVAAGVVKPHRPR